MYNKIMYFFSYFLLFLFAGCLKPQEPISEVVPSTQKNSEKDPVLSPSKAPWWLLGPAIPVVGGITYLGFAKQNSWWPFQKITQNEKPVSLKATHGLIRYNPNNQLSDTWFKERLFHPLGISSEHYVRISVPMDHSCAFTAAIFILLHHALKTQESFDYFIEKIQQAENDFSHIVLFKSHFQKDVFLRVIHNLYQEKNLKQRLALINQKTNYDILIKALRALYYAMEYPKENNAILEQGWADETLFLVSTEYFLKSRILYNAKTKFNNDLHMLAPGGVFNSLEHILPIFNEDPQEAQKHLSAILLELNIQAVSDFWQTQAGEITPIFVPHPSHYDLLLRNDIAKSYFGE